MKNEQLYKIVVDGKKQVARFYTSMVALDGQSGFECRGKVILKSRASRVEEIPDDQQGMKPE